MKLFCFSSLEKVFLDGPVHGVEQPQGSCLLGEKYAIQIAFYVDKVNTPIQLDLKTELQEQINVYKVEHVPSELPNGEGHDQDIITGKPGLFPDVLQSSRLPVQFSRLKTDVWYSFWIEFETANPKLSGTHDILFTLDYENKYGKQITSRTFQLEVIAKKLPKSTIKHTEWIHTDCLMNYYQIEAFSDEYWELVDKYISMAVVHSQNMMLTPIFTPPIDTNIGGERRTVQLVDIKKNSDEYEFDFTNLQKWSDICKKNNVQYLEIIHLFTQWGAKSTPKIEVTVDEEKVNFFGWETASASKEYILFLQQFIPSLIEWLKENEWDNNVYFHISDEPSIDDIEHYQEASNCVRKLVKGYPIIDAMSDYYLYKKGLVDIPVVANNQIRIFLDNKTSPLWTYYCGAHNYKVSNRFFDMPSYRNRILGYQLFKYNIDGFLHWGYNFWNTQYSKKAINPYEITDAEVSFPSGDSFVVYPGEKGPLPSLRLKVINEAFQDFRAMQAIENIYGRNAVDELIEKYLPNLSFDEYPKNQKYIFSIREHINKLIKDSMKTECGK
ncbi:DUF4091 domain-containing protein [Virgibacillus necropolis]|uniref:Glycoside hydrolase 123 catalytic domain-containing protein n=1 Tax=Virgibacillus necropolis TaxID=163877 RepID=A0A221M9M4_9BACI|nr:DUF4091 domain-containing protein [Virgibacillus necropolis]ASN04329.1 hypothetical protein CFK40_04540 [Virgibacillus necropolis]